METFTSNIVNSSFEHVLHSYGFHLISTYTYEVGNYFFDSIFYWLENQLSFLQVKQNSMTHLSQISLLNTKKAQ
jgi:hypothetical protein